ncbi:mitochondrial carrier [Choiromyces venosus 120613-1]|uniref:Mitochondrial thiamine pyrophosphate carrier 1 n=1 Tax=Choiromyces venosus 120613-1 TaxID=1336337 RepID=A0A3N4J6Q4_9PEZI|nr:mitochondrial carrier [Choiromyces venosus 120613-1]
MTDFFFCLRLLGLRQPRIPDFWLEVCRVQIRLTYLLALFSFSIYKEVSKRREYTMSEAATLRTSGGGGGGGRGRGSANAATDSTIPSAGHSRVENNKQSFNYIIRIFAAGGIAGCAAKTLIAPLDRVKILFQASSPAFTKYTSTPFGVLRAIRTIQQTSGYTGLFRGHSATLLRIFPYAAVKFVAYEQFRSQLIQSPEQETVLRRLAAGAGAGVVSVFATYPLEVVRVRLAFETRVGEKSSLRGIVGRLWREGGGGFAGFYRGFGPTVLGMLPYAGMSFLTHDVVGDWMRRKGFVSPHRGKPGPKRQLKAWAEMCAGGFAGMVSQTASYPFEVVRRRMQVGGAVGDGRVVGMAETAREIWRAGGVRGFFVGLSIGYVKVVPMVATSFFVYERSKTFLGVS